MSGPIAAALLAMSLMASYVHPPVPQRPPHAVTSAPRTALSGTATWYRYRSGQAAAGPALRAFLGRGWRGSVVHVCARGRCV